jgi:primase-polymerase (primpol)-like protein
VNEEVRILVNSVTKFGATKKIPCAFFVTTHFLPHETLTVAHLFAQPNKTSPSVKDKTPKHISRNPTKQEAATQSGTETKAKHKETLGSPYP